MIKQEFREFLRLNEVAKNPVEIKWKFINDELFGTFNVKSNDETQDFEIEATRFEENGVYQFKFYRDKQTKMFNDDKYMFVVVPTIKQALDYAMRKLNPEILVFAASDESKSRKSMYRLEAAKLASKYNYFDITRDKDLEELGFTGFVFGVYKSKDKLMKIINN